LQCCVLYFLLENTAHLNPAYPTVWTRQSSGGYFAVLLSHALENPSSQGSREDEASTDLALPGFGYSKSQMLGFAPKF